MSMTDAEIETTLAEIRKKLSSASRMEPPSGWTLEPILYGLTELIEHLIVVTKPREEKL